MSCYILLRSHRHKTIRTAPKNCRVKVIRLHHVYEIFFVVFRPDGLNLLCPCLLIEKLLLSKEHFLLVGVNIRHYVTMLVKMLVWVDWKVEILNSLRILIWPTHIVHMVLVYHMPIMHIVGQIRYVRNIWWLSRGWVWRVY